jgi:hypothetical protein
MTYIDRSDEVRELYALDNPDGAELLDRTAAWYGRFVRVTDPDDLNLLGLWTIHTHLVVETYTTPRLQVDSVIFGSGGARSRVHRSGHLMRAALNLCFAGPCNLPL